VCLLFPQDETVVGEIAALRTDRLDLEPLRVDHADEMARVLSDPQLHVFIGGSPPDVDQLRERYRRQVVGRSSDGLQRWLNWVVRRRDDGQALGYVQATVTQEPGGLSAEIAWVIGTAHQGRGYAREAAQAMAAWLRDQGVVQLVAHVHPQHRASNAVARSVGLVATDTVVDGEIRWRATASTPSGPRAGARPARWRGVRRAGGRRP
jgi:RimJ/RimL family protein N-acetyltransferase